VNCRIAGLGVGLGLIALGIASICYLQVASTRFDPTTWRAAETAPFNSDAPRLRMADGLLQSGKLLGKTSSEIDALLGPATVTDYFREFDLVYWLGAERSFMGIDSEWLVIKFASDGRVGEARIVTD